MKKLFFLIGICFFLSQSLSASVIASSVEPTLYEIGYGVKLPMNKILTLTPKEYKKLTGHRLGIFKSVLLKKMQKKLAKAPWAAGDKSQLVAALLCFAIGVLGIHRFYLGYTWQGIVQILTLGGLGIWVLIDFVRILTGDLQPKDGEYTTTL